jgi:hypothetical protein
MHFPFEVKVDSPESNNQLDEYVKHAKNMTPPPVIFTLSETEIRPSPSQPENFQIGWLSWMNLAGATSSGQPPLFAAALPRQPIRR